MAVFLADNEIDALISEAKPLEPGYGSKLQLKVKLGHKEREMTILGATGDFKIILRQSLLNQFDFSAILGFTPKNSSLVFRLRRYNGKSHEHTNKLERETFYDFHIHYATERYQQSGLREDAYAVATSRYADLQGALDCLFVDCGLALPSGEQQLLF